MEDKEKKNDSDLGFGNKSFNRGFRLVNRDGSFNVFRKGFPAFRPYDLFHALISMSWGRFLLLISVAFFLVNSLFALLYLVFGVEQIAGIENKSAINDFWDCFHFSVQTITSVGYGFYSPIGGIVKTISSVEAFLGLLGFALITGILYGRFSRPVSKIVYSDMGVIAPFNDGQAFMFRLANQRSSQLIEVEAEVSMAVFNLKTQKREFYPMPLQIKRITFLPLSWTVVHPIKEESPFTKFTREELQQGEAEIIVSLKAFDESFAQTVYNRTSFKYDEIVWDAKFKPIISFSQGHRAIVDLDELNKFENVG